MKQFILDSFVSKMGGGNKAAVVFDDLGLKDNEMLKISKSNNFSETAFIDINNSSNNEFMIRYFTPTEEVDICGHAALASFTVLKKLNYIGEGPIYHKTKAGRLSVSMENEQILIEMKKPEIVGRIAESDIKTMINLSNNELLLTNGYTNVISTGLPDIILELRNIEVLRNLVIDKGQMAAFCNKNNIIGMHVVSRETIEKDSDFCCRNFAPAVGIDEESATGTSNASMLYHMLCNNTASTNRIYKVEQGYFMNSPSNIYVKAEIINGEIVIYVGGKAAILSEHEISL